MELREVWREVGLEVVLRGTGGFGGVRDLGIIVSLFEIFKGKVVIFRKEHDFEKHFMKPNVLYGRNCRIPPKPSKN